MLGCQLSSIGQSNRSTCHRIFDLHTGGSRLTGLMQNRLGRLATRNSCAPKKCNFNIVVAIVMSNEDNYTCVVWKS